LECFAQPDLVQVEPLFLFRPLAGDERDEILFSDASGGGKRYSVFAQQKMTGIL
jgi:hypothetical protein